jgi:diguanylate cyclase (GGDEF)-like protein
MDKFESNVINQLKSHFLDILSQNMGLMRFDQVLEKMLFSIEKILNAQEVRFLCDSEWKEQLVVDGFHFEDPLQLSAPGSYKELVPWTVENATLENEPIYVQIRVHREQERVGYLTIIALPDTLLENLSDQCLKGIGEICGDLLKKAHELSQIAIKEKRYRQLFRVTEKFHASMDMNSVLEEIISILHEVYPDFTYYLFLSQDHYSLGHLPIKSLKYDSENIAVMHAYVTGTVQIEDSLYEQRSTLYAPLKGKQGVYGVLQIIAPNALVFPKSEVEFTALLANTAGSALENAQLYHQSKRLIADLQLINEVSHRLNSKLRLTDTVTYMCDQIISSFDAQEVGFVLFSEVQKEATILTGSTSFFFDKKVELYIQYFQDQLQIEKDAIFICDFNLLNDRLFRSIMAIPMKQTGVMEGFILVMHMEPYHFSFEAYKLLQSLIHHSTLAFANSTLRDELERMVVTDYLTKLYSRSYLDEKIRISMQEDAQGTFIMIDIDNFKEINDTFGHQVGDEVIIQVANAITGNIRDGDIGARWGGEELAIYLPRLPLEKGIMIANRLVEKVYECSSPKVSISCGVSHWNKKQTDTVKQLFSRADQALYKAKTTGKNKVIIQSS